MYLFIIFLWFNFGYFLLVHLVLPRGDGEIMKFIISGASARTCPADETAFRWWGLVSTKLTDPSSSCRVLLTAPSNRRQPSNSPLLSRANVSLRITQRPPAHSLYSYDNATRKRHQPTSSRFESLTISMPHDLYAYIVLQIQPRIYER